MKYNTTYTQKVSLKETIKTIDYIINRFDREYRTRFNALTITPPQFVLEGDSMLIDIPSVTRPITFDVTDGYKIGQLMLTHSNWTRSLFEKLSLDEGDGMQVRSNTIWRDLPINPESDTERQEMIFQFRAKDDADINQIIQTETNFLYSLIEEMEMELAQRYNLKKILPEKIPFVSAQMLENEYPALPFKAREESMADELIAFVLENPAIKLFSGHIHTYIPPEIYSVNHFNQILIQDTVNTSVLKVASVAKIATGQILSDQLTLSGKDELKETDFYNKQIKNDYNLVEVKINIGRLVMALLKKGHISELQAANVSDEAKVISSRYKIEIY